MSGDGILTLYQWVVDSINYVCKTVIGCRKNQARLLCLVRVFTVGAITIEILLPVLGEVEAHLVHSVRQERDELVVACQSRMLVQCLS